jgi:hypothetical protein
VSKAECDPTLQSTVLLWDFSFRPKMQFASKMIARIWFFVLKRFETNLNQGFSRNARHAHMVHGVSGLTLSKVQPETLKCGSGPKRAIARISSAAMQHHQRGQL